MGNDLLKCPCNKCKTRHCEAGGKKRHCSMWYVWKSYVAGYERGYDEGVKASPSPQNTPTLPAKAMYPYTKSRNTGTKTQKVLQELRRGETSVSIISAVVGCSDGLVHMVKSKWKEGWYDK